MKFFNFCSASALAVAVFTGTAHADPRGLWLAQDGARVRVNSCGQGLCAVIVSPKSPIDPATGTSWTDKNNPDPNKRGRPLVGIAVFTMMPDGPGKWSGPLYNVDNGQTYPGHVVEVDHDTIRVEGCALVCGGQNMRRIQ
ncbi:MAG: DUF2147 domain-containing protein [Xanthobacteraceae bacterium]